MDEKTEKVLYEYAANFFSTNYNYIYLKTMLNKAKSIRSENATLITGSSYALSGIKELMWDNAVSCSMSSQDLYYDFKCAFDVISSTAPGTFSKCIIVKGYYAAFDDLSSAPSERERVISNVYYPIFRDAHNWTTPTEKDLWENLTRITPLSDNLKKLIESIAVSTMSQYGTFYSAIKPRGGTVFNLNGRKWSEIPDEENDYLGKVRAESHNKIFAHKESMLENKEIIRDYVHFLTLNHITPVFAIAPFTRSYNRYLLNDMKESVLDMLSGIPEEVHFIDFNQTDLFDDRDFVDTDHLDENGALKMSRLLVDIFGK